MLKIGKKTKFISALLGTFLASNMAFAIGAETGWNLDKSAVKRATAGQFSTDSDNINSKDIFSLKRSFFSAGYLGQGTFSTNGGGTSDLNNPSIKNGVQAAFGVAIDNGMYFGFIGKYNFNDSHNKIFDTDNVESGNGYKINSDLAMRMALKINDTVAIHYGLLFKPSGSGPLYSVKKTYNEKLNNNYKEYIHKGTWEHEIAASIMLGEHKLNIPVLLGFKSDNTKKKGKEAGMDVNYKNYTGEDYVYMQLKPEVNLAIASGPMTGITVGTTLGFAFNNNVGPNGKNVNNAGQLVDFETKEDKVRVYWDVYTSFPLKWNLSGDKVQLAMEPKVSLGLAVTNTGNKTTKVGNVKDTEEKRNNNVIFTPYAELPIGTIWKPVEWYELRLGTAMIFKADYTWNTFITAGADGKLDNDTKTTSYEFSTQSAIAGFFGMGFIVGEDFDIDLYGEVSTLNLLTMDFGGQLTYRF